MASIGHIVTRVSKRHDKTQKNLANLSAVCLQYGQYAVLHWLQLYFVEILPNCKQTAER